MALMHHGMWEEDQNWMAEKKAGKVLTSFSSFQILERCQSTQTGLKLRSTF